MELEASPLPVAFPHFNGKQIKIHWPAGSKIPTIRGKWQRLSDGQIEATYTEDELKICLEKHDLIYEQSIK
jgi:hypothetical protein